MKPIISLGFLLFGLLIAGHFDYEEMQVTEVDCLLCHCPDLSTYKAYAASRPSPDELKGVYRYGR